MTLFFNHLLAIMIYMSIYKVSTMIFWWLIAIDFVIFIIFYPDAIKYPKFVLLVFLGAPIWLILAD